MSEWADEVMHQLVHDHGMDEEKALELYYALSSRYRWSGAVFTIRDVNVVIHEDEDEDGEGDWTGYWESEDKVTQAMRDALAWHWMWRRGIPDTLAERGNEFVPIINIYPSGEFDIEDVINMSRERYRADGSVVEEED